MTVVQGAAVRPTVGVRRPPLVRVELRKAVDTRSGRWLLGALAGLAAGADLVALVFGEPADRGVNSLLLLSQLPIGAILPLLGVGLVAGEWSQRTTLTTFALTPRRSRIVAAKLLAAVALALLVVAVSVVAALAGHAVAALATADAGRWGTVAAVGRVALFQVLAAAVGVGFGLLLLSVPAAVVAFFVLPTLVTAVVSMIPAVSPAEPWLDLLGGTTRLLGEPMPASAWAHLAVSFAVWGLVPLVAGTVRVRRTDLS